MTSQCVLSSCEKYNRTLIFWEPKYGVRNGVSYFFMVLIYLERGSHSHHDEKKNTIWQYKQQQKHTDAMRLTLYSFGSLHGQREQHKRGPRF